MNNDTHNYTMSIDGNDLIVYHNKESNKKYVCQKCIEPKSKRTKRLLCALRKRAGMTFIINTKINKNNKYLELLVQHPLYDDDIYYMYDINDKNYDSENIIQCQSTNNTNTKTKTKIQLCYIYILFLEQDKYYIGKSLKPLSRTGEHIVSSLFDDNLSRGAGWTKMYPPLKIIEIIDSYDEFDEDKYTLKYMKEKGIDNVRGGSFCELNLTRENVVTLEKMLAGAEDRCYYCGNSGHYINTCPQKNIKRIPQKKKKLNIKKKDIPKSKIMNYFGASQLLMNSDLNTDNPLEKVNNTININNTNNTNNIKQDSDSIEKFSCKYCKKTFTTYVKKNNHENLLCVNNVKVTKGKKIDADVDAILEANKRFIKDKKK